MGTHDPITKLDIEGLIALGARLFAHADAITNVARQDIANDFAAPVCCRGRGRAQDPARHRWRTCQGRCGGERPNRIREPVVRRGWGSRSSDTDFDPGHHVMRRPDVAHDLRCCQRQEEGLMPTFRELTGQKFGRLTVIRFAGKDKHGRSTWLCRCECGKQTTIEMSQLVTGHTLSCGCLKLEKTVERSTTHGHARRRDKSPEYRSWGAMLTRCRNQNLPHWGDYGGRGIKVCDRWLHGEGGLSGFECFLLDMGKKPSPKHSIDRWPDKNGNYKPGNCRWATPKEQARNTRRNTKLHGP